MTPYLAAYSIYLFGLFLCLNKKFLSREILFLISLPFIFLVFLRGFVGVDTSIYVNVIYQIYLANSYTYTFEPIFEFIILALLWFTRDPMLVLKAIGICTTAILFLANSKSKIYTQVLALALIPYFYLDMTMNGLRYGLAFAIIFFAAPYLLEKNKRYFYILSAIAGMIHISALALAGLFFVLVHLRWKIILLLILGFLGIFFLGADYFLLKLKLNKTLGPNSSVTGIGILLLSLIILIPCFFVDQIRDKFKTQLYFLLTLTLGAYLVTQIFYAGIRLQQINLFLVYLFLIYAIDSRQSTLPKLIFWALIASCVFGSALKMRNFYQNEGIGKSPYAPYMFFWENSPDKFPELGVRGLKVPDDFNPEEYLRLHPDVKEAGANPENHYLWFGKKEGRIYKENKGPAKLSGEK